MNENSIVDHAEVEAAVAQIKAAKNLDTLRPAIKAWRTAHHLTQQELADKIQLSRNALQNLEGGRPSLKIPDWKSVENLLLALGLGERDLSPGLLTELQGVDGKKTYEHFRDDFWSAQNMEDLGRAIDGLRVRRGFHSHKALAEATDGISKITVHDIINATQVPQLATLCKVITPLGLNQKDIPHGIREIIRTNPAKRQEASADTRLQASMDRLLTKPYVRDDPNNPSAAR